MIVPLIVVLAIADDVHIIQHYGEARRRMSAEQAFRGTVSHLAAPLLGASGTTALGMLSLATSQVVAVREFGIGSAVGVMVDFAISLVVMPTALSWLKPEPERPPQETWLERPMLAIARLSTTRARTVLAVSVGIGALAAAGLSRLHVDTNHINFFSRHHPLGESAEVIDTRLSGIYTFQVFLEGDPDSLRRPDAIARMDRVEARLRELPFVRKVTGLPDYVRRIHRELQARDAAAPPGAAIDLPADEATIAQELLVFSLADQGRVELERVAASDFSKAQITIKLASMSSDLVFEQIRTAEGLVADAFAGTGIRATVTGSGRLFSTLDHYLVISQISSFATAFLTVFGVIFVLFRSWRFGALAIIPNVIPVLAVFGIMGWWGISLNVATIMLASVALGVVDDDTIHFVSRYRRETAAGVSTVRAIEIATASEGRASLTTALINSASFGVLMLSEYRPTAWFGGLLALTMLVAFLAEVFILPATIVLLPRLFGGERVHGRRARTVAVVDGPREGQS
jgi:predicted RND superfamily exporter protein